MSWHMPVSSYFSDRGTEKIAKALAELWEKNGTFDRMQELFAEPQENKSERKAPWKP